MTDINALDPVSDRGEGSLAGDVVQQHHPIRSPEVGLRHTPEPAQSSFIVVLWADFDNTKYHLSWPAVSQSWMAIFLDNILVISLSVFVIMFTCHPP